MNAEERHRGRSSRAIVVLAAAVALLLTAGISGAACPDDAEFTMDFPMGSCTFSSTGANAYFSLNPGYRLVLEGEDEGDTVRNVITVLNETAIVGGITARVVEERESIDDVVVEISRNFFAICDQTGDVYYLGEDVAVCDDDATGGFAESGDKCLDDSAPTNPGQWRIGENDAMAGVIMPGTFFLGARYFQEIAINDGAIDRGENTAMGLSVVTAAGTFTDCVEVVDTNPADGICERIGGDVKRYCPGVGQVQDEDLLLLETSGSFGGDDAASGSCATFDAQTNTVHIPCVDLGAPNSFWADLLLNDGTPATFTLEDFGSN